MHFNCLFCCVFFTPRAFLKPYEKVVRALNVIQESWETFGSKPDSVSVPRGTLQVCFIHKFLTCNGLISCLFYCAKRQFGILGDLV